MSPSEPAGSWRRLLVTTAAVFATAAVLSHLVAAALGVGYTPINRLVVRPDLPGVPVAVLGSSITLFGVGHDALADALSRPLREWFVPSGSPAELELLQVEVGPASATVIGVSIYDMNELVLADRRPELVPIQRATADLLEMNADWAFTKRILGQYLLQGTARVFPTAGQSSLVMVGFRSASRDVGAGRWPGGRSAATMLRSEVASSEAVVFDPRSIPEFERTLGEWPPEERLRSVANYRATRRDRHTFFGPKWLALKRLARAAAQGGPTVVVVFPVSPLYTREFLDDPIARARFEEEVEILGAAIPTAAILRLDRDPALQADRAFRDLVHLGPEGRRRATEALAARLLHP